MNTTITQTATMEVGSLSSLTLRLREDGDSKAELLRDIGEALPTEVRHTYEEVVALIADDPLHAWTYILVHFIYSFESPFQAEVEEVISSFLSDGERGLDTHLDAFLQLEQEAQEDFQTASEIKASSDQKIRDAGLLAKALCEMIDDEKESVEEFYTATQQRRLEQVDALTESMAEETKHMEEVIERTDAYFEKAFQLAERDESEQRRRASVIGGIEGVIKEIKR